MCEYYGLKTCGEMRELADSEEMERLKNIVYPIDAANLEKGLPPPKLTACQHLKDIYNRRQIAVERDRLELARLHFEAQIPTGFEAANFDTDRPNDAWSLEERSLSDEALRHMRDFGAGLSALPFVVLFGNRGSEKTHLAVAAARRMVLRTGGKTEIANVADMLDRMREGNDRDSAIDYHSQMRRVKEVPLLVLDDFGAERTTAFASEVIYTIVNHRHMYRRPTVVTTNAQILDIKVRGRILSRLLDWQTTKILRLDLPDYRNGQRRK